MFKPNTVQVPIELVEIAARGEVPSESVYYAAMMLLDRPIPNVDTELAVGVRSFLEGTPKLVAGMMVQAQKVYHEENKRNRGSQVNLPPAEPIDAEMPLEEYGVWLYRELSTRFPKAFPPKDSVIEELWQVVRGNQEVTEMAIALAEDYHRNKDEIKSPGGFILRSLREGETDDFGRLRWKYEKLQKEGTAITNGASRVSRTLQRTQEEIAANPRPVRDNRFREALADDVPEGVEDDEPE